MAKLLVLLVFLGSFSHGAPTPIQTVFTVKAKPQELYDVLSYPSRIESKVNATIYSESDGVVVKISAPLGTKVKKKAPLVITKHTDPIYQYAPLIVRAPVEGVVSQVLVTEGTRVTKGQNLMALTDPKNVKLNIEVSAEDIGFIKKGMRGEFAAQGLKQGVEVEVKGLSPVVDTTTGTATGELLVINANNPPLPGLIGQVTFKTNKRKGVLFPEQALFYKDEEVYLRLVKGGVLKRVPVKVGHKQKGMVEILSGVSEGDEVVERASGFVADGEKVNVQSSEEKKDAKTL